MRAVRALLTAISFLTIGLSQAAAQNSPSVTLQSILNYTLYDNGRMMIDKTDLAFAPAAPLNAELVIRSKAGEQLGVWKYFDSYRVTQAVFGRMSTTGGAMQRFEVGEYVLDYVVDGSVVTSAPFSVTPGSTSDDAFNPKTTVKFVGPWQQWAYLAPHGRDADSAASVHFWAGGGDLPEGQRSAGFVVKVFRNGALIAHSNPRTGHIDHRWMSNHRNFLQEPHEANKAHLAKNVTLAELSKDGAYEVTVELVETGDVIRTYTFKSAGGKITPHPRTALGYNPSTDYIAPRATVLGSNVYEFQEVHWIEGRP